MDPIVELEGCAFRAWPAEEVVDLDGWRLRHTRGVTRRGNSAWSGEAGGSLSLEARLDRLESFYGERRLPPLVQVAPGAQPAGLDAALAARGYAIEAPVDILVADAEHVAGTRGPTCVVSASLTDHWFTLSGGGGRFAAVQPIYRALLERLGARAAYAWVDHQGAPAAVGLGVIDGAWLGIFAMLTRPALRGRGLGGAILRGLAGHALRGGAARLYLQVERDHAVAQQLYARVGFARAYGYHYRIGMHGERGPSSGGSSG